MRFVRASEFTGDRAWAADDLAELSGSTTVRLHWTDQPYVWHVNDGVEVFTVVDGDVDMHYRDADGNETVVRLTVGDTCIAEEGDEHFAEPVGSARILVVERAGSV